jgi:hypothetical protein
MNLFLLVAKLSNHHQQLDYEVLQAGIEKVVSPLNHNGSIAMTFQENTLYVPGTVSLSRAENVLMFNQPPPFEKFCLDFGNSIIASYTKINCGLPDSLVTQQSRIYDCLFKYSGRADKNLIGFQRIRVSHETRDGENVWLNPLIVRLKVAGDELAKPDNINMISVQVELHKIKELENVFFEPYLGSDFNGRVALLSYLGDKVREQPRSMTVVESLLFGTQPTKNAVVAFVALDALGGAFEIRGYGSGEPKFIWHPPIKGLSPNGKKLAEALLLEWGGTLEALGKWPVATPAPQRVPEIYNPLWESMGLVSQVVAKEIARSAEKALEISNIPAENNEQTTIAYLYDIINYNRAVFDGCHIGHYRLRKFDDNQWEFLFDLMGFYQDFAQRFLVPRSPVFINLPVLDHDNLDRLPKEVLKAYKDYEYQRQIDLVNSLDYGARTLLVQVLHYSNEPVLAEQCIDLPYCFGWPWQWYQLLYRHPFHTQLHFQLPLSDSAVLGHAQVGMAILGTKVSSTVYKALTPISM